MPFSVTCPSCGKSFQLAQEIYERKVAGKIVSIKCKQCQSGIRIDATESGTLKVIGSTPAGAEAAAPTGAQAARARQATLIGMMGPSGKPVTASTGDAGALWAVDAGGAGEDRELDDATIAREIAAGAISPDTLVWRDGMGDWLEVSKVPELARHVPSAKKPEPAKVAAPLPAARAKQPSAPEVAAPAPAPVAKAPAPAMNPAPTAKAAAPVVKAPAAAPVAKAPAPTAKAAAPAAPAIPSMVSEDDDEEATMIFRSSAEAVAKLGLDAPPPSEEEAAPAAPRPAAGRAVVAAPLPAAGRPAASAAKAPSAPLNPAPAAKAPSAPLNPAPAAKAPSAPLNPAPAAKAPSAPLNPAPAAKAPSAPLNAPAAKAPSAPLNPGPAAKAPSAPLNPAPAAKAPSSPLNAPPPAPPPPAVAAPTPLEPASPPAPPPPRAKQPSAPVLPRGLTPPPEPPTPPPPPPSPPPPPALDEPPAALPPVRPRQQSAPGWPRGLTPPPDRPTPLGGAPTPPPTAPPFVPTQNPFAAAPAAPGQMGQLAPNPFAVATTTDLEYTPSRSKTPLVIGGVVLVLVAAGVAFAVLGSGAHPPPPPVPAAPPSPPPQAATPAPAQAEPHAADTPAAPAHPSDDIAGTPRPSGASSGDFSQMFAAGAEKAQKGSSTGGEKAFDPEAAKTAVAAVLKLVAACKEPGGPTGQSNAAVTFDASGHVSSVTIGAPFSGTSTGTCIIGAFKNASMPPFSGLPGTISQPVSLL